MTTSTHPAFQGEHKRLRDRVLLHPSGLWFLLGAAASLLAIGQRWDVPLLAWIAPVLLLRFSRTTPVLVALLGLMVASTAQIAAYIVASAAPFNTVTTTLCLVLGAIFTAPFALDRLLIKRLHPLGRILLLPAAVAVVEFASASLLPVGASIGTRAITQGENIALLQLTALLGPYAIGFLIAAVATVANEIWDTPARATALRFGGGLAVVLFLVFGAGELRLAYASARPVGETVRIVGITPSMALREPAKDGVSMASFPASAATLKALDTPQRNAAYQAVQQELLAKTREAARSGAQIVVWSETAAPVFETGKTAFLQQVAALAREEGIYINAAIGIAYRRNETFLIGPDGRQHWHYQKNKPVPGMEPVAPVRNAPPLVHTPFGVLVNVICFDGDFPALARRAADIMLVPAWDWPEEGYVHTMKMARVRAVENGYSMVRVDYDGVSAAFDPYGRVLAMQDTTPGKAHMMVVDVPIQGVNTFYGQVGDMFAWLCGLTTLALCGLALARPRLAASPSGLSDPVAELRRVST